VSTAQKPLADIETGQLATAAKLGCLPCPLWSASAALGYEFRELACRCCSKFPGNRPHAGEMYSQLSWFSGNVSLQGAGHKNEVSFSPHDGCDRYVESGSALNVEAEHQCCVDISSSGFPITDYTPSFMKCCGLVSNEASLFLDLVTDPIAFQQWVNLCIQNLQHASLATARSGLQIVLRTPSLLASGMELHAQCTVTLDQKFEMQFANQQARADPLILQVVLHHLRQQQLPAAPNIEGTVEIGAKILAL